MSQVYQFPDTCVLDLWKETAVYQSMERLEKAPLELLPSDVWDEEVGARLQQEFLVLHPEVQQGLPLGILVVAGEVLLDDGVGGGGCRGGAQDLN